MARISQTEIKYVMAISKEKEFKNPTALNYKKLMTKS